MSRLPPGYDIEPDDEDGEGETPAPAPLADPVREAKMQVARAVMRRRRAALAALGD